MSVAPNGRIDIIWLDTRDDPGTYLSSLYYSFSEDNGQTWSQNERLSPAFDPHVGWPQQNKMGDYFDMISDDYGASIAWAGTFNGEEDVYYGRISQMPVAINDEKNNNKIPKTFSLYQNYPNPFNPSTNIQYAISSRQFVTLKVYDIIGNELATLVSEEKPAGTYEVNFNTSSLPSRQAGIKHIPSSGIYFYTLTAGSFVETKKMILMK